MAFGQIVDLVMVNKQIKFHKICFNTEKILAKVKVCHDDDNDYAAANADDDDGDTRVMTIPRLFFFEKTAELIKNGQSLRCSKLNHTACRLVT